MTLRRLAMPLAFALALAALIVALPRPARAFGDVGAFDPRVLLVGGVTGGARMRARPRAGRGSSSSARARPARLKPTQVRADDPAVVDAPFLWLSGDSAARSRSRRRRSPGSGSSSRSAASCWSTTPASPTTARRAPSDGRAREQIARVLPDTSPIALGQEHVIFKTFYLLRRAEGRVAGPKTLEAIVRGGQVQVVFSSHDLGGALARGATGAWENPVVPGGDVAARAGHPPRREHRHVHALLELQGRPGPRAVPDAPARTAGRAVGAGGGQHDAHSPRGQRRSPALGDGARLRARRARAWASSSSSSCDGASAAGRDRRRPGSSRCSPCSRRSRGRCASRHARA